MTLKKLPDDIRKYVFRKVYSVIFKFLILEIFAVLFLMFFHERIIEIAGKFDFIITCIVIVLLPFLITGFPFKLIDSSWHGTVVDIKVKTTIAFAGRLFASNMGNMYYKNTVHLKVKKDNGKIVDVIAFEIGVPRGSANMFTDKVIMGNLDDHIDNFQIGDSVYHVYGLKRPVIKHNSQNNFCYCVVCGYRNFADDFYCSGCKHSLIKISD